MNANKTGCLLAIIGFVNGSALANNNWTVGVAALHQKGPYFDSKTTAAPLIIFEKSRLTLSTLDGISYQYFNFSDNTKQEASLSVFATPGFAPDFGGNAIYTDIKRKHGVDVGIQGSYKYGVSAIEFRGLADVTNRHNGYELSTQISYQPDAIPLELGFGARYRSKELNQYLFGVKSFESNQNRPAFSADGATTVFITALVAYPVTQKLLSYGQFVYEDISSLAKSPLVTHDSVSTITLGVMYQW